MFLPYILIIFFLNTVIFASEKTDERSNTSSNVELQLIKNSTALSINNQDASLVQKLKEVPPKKSTEKTSLLKKRHQADDGSTEQEWGCTAVRCLKVSGVLFLLGVTGLATWFFTSNSDQSIINDLYYQIQQLQNQIDYLKAEMGNKCNYDNFLNCVNGTGRYWCRKLICGDEEMYYKCGGNEEEF